MSNITVTRKHEIHCGHRVVGHEGRCKNLHGHSYIFHFTCQAEQLDSVGRVIDFSEIKSRLCMWLEDNWDHKFLAWCKDVVCIGINNAVNETSRFDTLDVLDNSFVFVPFNPTAENIAKHLVEVIGPQQLKDTGIILTKVVVEETAKCSATFSI